MTPFIVLATLLVVVVALPLALTLARRPRNAVGGTDRQAANLAIFRDQLAELEHERAEGSLAAGDFAQAKQELQRRLLDEAIPEGTVSREAAPAKKTALLVVVLLPLLALGGYGLLGNPAALDPAARQPAPRMTAGDIEAMVGKLARRLAQNPDDTQGWVMLARSYKALGRYPEAADAYAKGISLVEQEPLLLADYAEVLAIAGGGFRGKPSELIDKALKLAPDEPQVLLLAGAAADERRDYASAIAHWEKVLAQLEAGSEEAATLQEALAKAREALAASRKSPKK